MLWHYRNARRFFKEGFRRHGQRKNERVATLCYALAIFRKCRQGKPHVVNRHVVAVMPLKAVFLRERDLFSVLGNGVIAIHPDVQSVDFAYRRNLRYRRRDFVEIITRCTARHVQSVERVNFERRSYDQNVFVAAALRIASKKRCRRNDRKHNCHKN